jgi:hypothetical protein
MELEDYFKTPSQEEIDRQWLTQLCYDGQMADDEIEEHVDAIIEWNEKRVKNNVDLYIVSQQRELLLAFKNWEVDNDIKNLLPEQVVDFYIDEANNCA